MAEPVPDYGPPPLTRTSPTAAHTLSLPLRILRAAFTDYLVPILTVLYFLAVLPFLPQFASSDNLHNIFTSMLPLLAVAVGQTLVMITGGIDLSVAAVISFSSVVGASVMSNNTGLLARHPAAVPIAIFAMLFAGVVVGLLNGAAVTLLRMPPFIVTLTTWMFFGGLAVTWTNSDNIAGLPRSFLLLDRGRFAALPFPFWIVLALAAIAQLLLWRTLIGRWLYAVGLNAKASRVSGVPVGTTVVFAYAASGFCAAVAGVLYTARLRTGSPTLGEGKLLDVIGAVVIGGTSLFGGKGSVLKTVFGVLFFALLANTLDWFNLGHAVTQMTKGGVILLAATLDLLRNRVLAER